MNRFFKTFSFFIILIILGLWIYASLYNPFGGNETKKEFEIKKGEDLSTIALHLKEEGIISSKLLFSSYVFLKDKQGVLKAGKYFLSASMGINKIAQKFIEGEDLENKIIIIEGWNLNNIADYLEKQKIVKSQDFLKVTGQPRLFLDKFSVLEDKPIEAGLEGYLFPDTYSIPSQASSNLIIEKMLSNLEVKLSLDLRQEIRRQGKTIFQILTMASILEKEVRSKEDKQIVSGIFWKRIANHYPLQSCATIAYALGKNKWRYSIKDTKINSPYNTYQRLGLPIGPICNPGLESIEAAIYPKKTNFWYYLSAPNGETIFSKTLREHNIARRKYLK